MTAAILVYWYHICIPATLPPRRDIIGNYIHSGDGDMNIAIGEHSVAKQTNYNNAPQGVPAEELLKLLTEIKARLPELPEEIRDEVQHEVDGAQLYAKKDKPDQKKIAAKLMSAQDILKAIPATVAAALPVGELLGKALIWCSKAAGMWIP